MYFWYQYKISIREGERDYKQKLILSLYPKISKNVDIIKVNHQHLLLFTQNNIPENIIPNTGKVETILGIIAKKKNN